MSRRVTLPHLARDTQLLFATRFIRLFAYGSLSVVLVFYLVGLGLSQQQVGVLLTLTLVGDTAISLTLTTRADRIGRGLSALFALDSFGGGFVVQAFAAYWFHLRFGVDPAGLGAIFFWANVFAGFSALVASRLAARIGLIRTMVFTHVPSNILLILVPLMPSFWWAVAMLLLRFSISQMDVPARQSYVMAVVTSEERSAAGGVTGVARTIGAAISPLFVGLMFARPALWNLPFFLAGTLKIVYDVMLYRGFVAARPPEEAQH